MLRLRSALTAALVTVGAGIGGALAVAAPAAAHVTANADEAVQGGYARVAFRVPNESPTASTTRLEVTMPADAPLPSVSTQPVPGWTVAVVRQAPATPLTSHGREIKEIVSKITWTATPAAVVRPGQFQEFPVSMGQLPEVERLVFKALQTYSDGNIVRWIEVDQGDGQELERPAPVLELTPKDAETGAGTAKPAAAEADNAGPSSGLAVAGLVAGLAGLGLGAAAFVRSGRSTKTAA
ncbi:YcnI family protein [Pilimelia columellifera]|uniref:YcnI family protein n=1 Tax=Pilimelia columellifera subsp. columellifera TaxID=706583 RepID=A0ABN3NIU2_9ACTN